MNQLSEQQQAELHQSLLNLRGAMQQVLADSCDGARPVSLDAPIGRLSRMDALQQQSMVQANRRTAQTRLAHVEAALRRHADGVYGLCTSCEEEIGYARLKARPEAPLCISCQADRETKGSR